MNALQKILLTASFSFLSVLPAVAQENTPEKIILDNGLTVIIQPMPSVETISMYAYIKTGSATEGNFLGAGISHFVEHMLFKGTSKRGVGQIAKDVQGLGGEVNAHTTLDYTMYILDVPKGTFNQGLDIISDMVMNSAFDPVQVDKERQVIHGEMRLYHDRPDRVLNDLVFKNVYIRHPYRHITIGDEALFDQITRDQLFDYYKTRYIPNNMIFSVAGAVNKEEILPLIKAAFKDFKPLPYPDRHVPVEPPQVAPRFYTEEYPTPLYRFSLAYQGVGLLDTDMYAMDVLAMALGQGESSRLYKDIYEKRKLVRSISASDFTPQDKGIFEVEVVMAQDNTKATVAAIDAILADIKQHGLSQEELDKTKRQVLSGFIFANQTSNALAYRNALDEAMTGDVNFSQYYVEAIKHLTNEDIKRVANRYFNETNRTLVVLKPKTAAAKIEAKAAVVQSPIQKIVLGNGLTILLKEDHTSPVVALQVVMNAGTRQESPALNGISELTSRAWVKATRQMDSQALALAIEKRGGSLNNFAGRNTIGFKMDVLSDDMPFAVGLMADLVKQPAFDTKVIDQERSQMLADIDARDDDITSVTFKELLQTLFLTHPFRLDSLGTKATVQHITPADVQAYYKHFANPNNMVVAVFGDIDSAKVVQLLLAQFSGLKKEPVMLNLFTEAPPAQGRNKALTMDKEQAVVTIGFQAPTLSSKDRFAMEIIDGILGSGLSGRLFVKVRDELGKAYTVGSQYTPGLDTGLFAVYVLTTADKVEAVQGIVWKEISALANTPVSDEELKAMKNYLKGSFKMSLNTPAVLTGVCALDELYGLGYDFYKHYDAAIDAITAQDVQRVAGIYLQAQKAATVITTPKTPSQN